MSDSSQQILYFSNGTLLIGVKDGNNVMFTTPSKFLHEDGASIIFNKNGQEQLLGFDYIIEESGGLGTGFDTVVTRRPPRIFDSLTCHYLEDC